MYGDALLAEHFARFRQDSGAVFAEPHDEFMPANAARTMHERPSG
jgi:hypothetical protein